MSWGLYIVGRDKEKLKEAIRAKQCQDEEKNPHSGVPSRVVNFLCSEIDRVRIYEYNGRKYAVIIEATGSFHEQGLTEKIDIRNTELVE